MKIQINDLMHQSGVKFGTSGARGLVTDMTDAVCYAYTFGFLQYLEASGEIRQSGEKVAVAGDLRPSTKRIMKAVMKASADRGYTPINCGASPSPAVALYGLENRCPAIMVTGSHIPDDRNGIKFNKCSGEILKYDEEQIREQIVEFEDQNITDLVDYNPPKENIDARCNFVARYTKVFDPECLAGTTVGVYQHSAVGRDLLIEIFSSLGAHVTPLGRSSTFIPVDTEAIRPEDVMLARDWAAQNKFDAIISTDGDSDRPLISDEHGEWLRGDVVGILAARYLGADSISTPVSCNTALEKSGWFRDIRRTKIGSPFVVASMQEALLSDFAGVVGYEANGGFLTHSNFEIGGKSLGALPTRDAVLPVLSVLLLAVRERKTISELVAALPSRYTASGRIQDFPTEKSAAILEQLLDSKAIKEVFGCFGTVQSIDRTDGLRITFASDEVLHLRPSGNAPEFRCYNEAASQERVHEMQRMSMDRLLEMKAEL